MPALELPGFYYDEAKRKYFKKQPHHVAASGSGHTGEDAQELAEGLKASFCNCT